MSVCMGCGRDSMREVHEELTFKFHIERLLIASKAALERLKKLNTELYEGTYDEDPVVKSLEAIIADAEKKISNLR
jgi:hypothetical protein